MPQLPRPGVIPLGPLGLGDIFNGAFGTIGRYWKQLFGLVATMYGCGLLLVVAAAGVAYAIVGDDLRTVLDLPSGTDPGWDQIRPLVIAFCCLWVFAMLVYLATLAMTQAVCPVIVQDAVLGRPTTFGAAWRRAASRAPAVAGTIVLSCLIAYVPVLLGMAGFIVVLIVTVDHDSGSPFWLIPLGVAVLALGPLSIWLWVRFSLAPTVAVVESAGPVTALRRSAKLVRGSWWRILGISLLGSLLAGVAAGVVQQLVSFIGIFSGLLDMDMLSDPDSSPTFGEFVRGVGGYLALLVCVQLITQAFATTFPQLILNLLYVDRRIRAEDLATALFEATATPDAAADPSATADTSGTADPSGTDPDAPAG